MLDSPTSQLLPDTRLAGVGGERLVVEVPREAGGRPGAGSLTRHLKAAVSAHGAVSGEDLHPQRGN